jgi:Uncharacterized protein conserved in bacteria
MQPPYDPRPRRHPAQREPTASPRVVIRAGVPMIRIRASAARSASGCWRRPLVVLSLALTSCTSSAATAGPTCIAPANPGGGWDFTCRSIASVMGERTPTAQAIHVINVPGSGGAVAFERTVSGMARNGEVIVAASPSTLLGIAQGHYGSRTEHDVRWLASVGAEPSVLAVRADAPWHTLAEFVADWKKHPETIRIGGASVVGGQDHMKMLLLARAAGVDIHRLNYSPLSGPLEALASLASGTIQVFPGDASEVRGALERKQIRVLTLFGQHRSTGVLAGVPTAREQGLDVSFVVWRGFYAPPGISDADYDRWVQRIAAMTQSPEWKALLARNGLTPFYLGGRDFERFVGEQTADYRTVSKQIGVVQ